MQYHKNSDGIITIDGFISNYEPIYLGTKKYYFKYTKILEMFYEYIGSVIAEEYGIDQVCYKIAEIDGFLGVISLDFIGDNNYVSASSILKEFGLNNNLKDIILCIKRKYNVDLTDSMIKMFLFDVLIANSDRHSENYGILEKNKEVRLAPIFDNGEMLSDDAIEYGGYAIGIDRVDCYIESDDIRDNYLYKFFQYYSEYEDYFSSKLDIISNKNILKILERVEDESKQLIPIDIRKKIISRFDDNNRMISKVMSKRG